MSVDNQFLSLFGYMASALVALSMTISSIVKFRWVNLLGACSFCMYGILIGTLPVAFLNGFIVCVDLYYLWGIYSRKEVFEILEIPPGSEYLLRFVNFHHEEIQKYCPGFEYRPDMNTMSYYILRDMHVAGIFLARKEQDVLTVGLDFVIPEFRDFKNGKFIYQKLSPGLKKSGIQKIKAAETNRFNAEYFRKIGFKKDEEGFYALSLI
jgi:hypothetical protein